MNGSSRLAKRTLFITGASRGIGKAIALRAALDGANIVIAAKTTTAHPKLPGTIYTAAKEVEEAGGNCLPCAVDIRDEEQVGAAVEQAVAQFGGIDVLINNASAIHLTGTSDTPMKRFDLMMNINTRGTFMTSKLCIPYLKKAPNPHILNISPPLNMKSAWFSPHCAYTIAKYGMSMCALGMADELKGEGIGVNTLWPRTAIATAALEMLGGKDYLLKSRKPEIMADAACVIITGDSRLVTGKFFVDEDVLRESGVQEFGQYAVVPGNDLLPDYFLDGAEPQVQEYSTSNASPSTIFAKVEEMLTTDVVKMVNATFLFVLDEEECWLLNLKNGQGSISKATTNSTADATLKMKSCDLVEMFTGCLNPTQAFMSGKLKISGNMGKAMALETLVGKMKSKLN